ncbi:MULTISPECIES: hypothetical protein [unclassified Stenotrophomonas]|uniref:hypothetical protein n=1 Tax=unclassified Stenotrophomonas TaxID=196198 RepID=UPI002117AFA2|nr:MULTISPECIES: hypothetical protein [unclassified Stenotrophomonas]
MKKNPLLIIGVVGLVITAAMHLGMSLAGVSRAGSGLGLWMACYSAWLGFSIIGLVLSRKR